MLTIRDAQQDIFSQIDVRRFEDWMLAHLRKFFPKQCVSEGESRMRETIEQGIVRAEHYGFVAKSDVCKFIDLTVVFGRDFDNSKRLTWAREILNGQRNPSAKMQSLYEAAVKQLKSF